MPIAPTRQCPSRDELLAFNQGELPDALLETIASHLSDCAECTSELRALPSSADALLSSLRGLSPSAAVLDDKLESEMAALEMAALASAPTAPEKRGQTALAAPSQLREYRILEKLGEGGMGAVYRAVHTRLDRVVALKTLAATRMRDRGAVARFGREMKAVGKLQHPNIVAATDAGEVDGTHFLVMEMLDGLDVASLLRRLGPLSVADACEILRQAALGLAHAHAHGLVHRDVKPSNLMLTADGIVKVLDLGLARLQSHLPVDEGSTSAGMLMGSFDYMAPEQGNDPHSVDRRADLYSLGCTLYELLSGKPPFHSDRRCTPMQKMLAHAQTPVPRLRERRPDAPPALEGLVDRLLAKAAMDRFADADDTARRLAPFTAGADLPRLLRAALARDHTAPVAAPASPEPALVAVEALSAAPSATARLRREPGGRRRAWGRRLGVMAALAGAVVLLGIIYVQTDHGMLEIKTADEDVKISVLKNGKEIELVDLKTRKLVRLGTGDYELRIVEGAKDLEVQPDRVVLKRGGQPVVEVRRIGGRKGPALDKAWLKLVAALPPEKQLDEVSRALRRRNPDFDGKFTKQVVQGGKVVEVRFHTDEVTDLAPLDALPELSELTCWGSRPGRGKLADLAPLRHLPLASLDCAFNKIEDLGPLRGKQLVYLNCHGNPIGDLGPLAGMPLQRLDAGGTRVADLTPLKGLPLAQLSVAQARVRSLAPLQEVTTLATLDCSGNPLTDLAPLKGLMLKALNVQRTGVTDLSPLENLPLTDLFIDRPEDHAASLRRLPKLQRVNGRPLADVLKDAR